MLSCMDAGFCCNLMENVFTLAGIQPRQAQSTYAILSSVCSSSNHTSVPNFVLQVWGLFMYT